MFERLIGRLGRKDTGAELHWLSANVVTGTVRHGAWPALRDAGVRAVVYLGETPGDPDAAVRQHGMRYLRYCLHGAPMPTAEDLRIVTAWVKERTEEDGPVFIQDSAARFNDGLVAVAALVRGGMPAHLALLALGRAVPRRALDRRQQDVLVRFTTALEAGASLEAASQGTGGRDSG